VPQNLEIKVACTAEHHALIRVRLASRRLNSVEQLRQVDTYFHVSQSRLKLRETTTSAGQSAELIQYWRPDECGARTSSYRRVPLGIEQVADLKAALNEALAVLATVRKERTVAIWQSTRIHLDSVEQLGHFVELETILGDGDAHSKASRAEFESVVDWLGLAGLESIPGSYSDLLIQKGFALS
jgi:predicted adenylyl cyclase CyaB